MDDSTKNVTSLPAVVDRAAWQAELDALRVREKAHTHEGDAIAAARRRLPMVEVDAAIALIGPDGPVTLLDDVRGPPAARSPTTTCGTPANPPRTSAKAARSTTGRSRELSILHSRDVTYATFCQGPYEESVRYRDFMGWDVPWYSAQDSADALLAGRRVGMFYLVCYLRDGDRVFETYWTRGRGVEAMAPSYGLLDMTVHGRQERWEDSPAGWPQRWGADGEHPYRIDGRPSPSGRACSAGRSDDLGAAVG